MCNNFPNIKVVKGNAFALLMPLKKRTFESCEPIDEDIDATQLTDLVVKFGGVEYQASTSEDGVQIIIPADIAVGTYSIVLTAMYEGSAIRAAYESAVTIVDYNSQSDAQQYIAGSPIVLDAAYVIGGTLTDAELEALKEEYREKNAQLAEAIADAEEAKHEWEQKAAYLDGVAQESTSQDILTAVENIDIDLTPITDSIGTPSQGQSPTLFGAIGDVVQQVVQGVINETSVNVTYDGVVYQQPYEGKSPLEVFSAMRSVISIVDDVITEAPNIGNPFRFAELTYLQYIKLSKCAISNTIQLFNSCKANEIDAPVLETAYHSTFSYCQNLKKINIPLFNPISGQYNEFVGTPNLIDIITGAEFDHSIQFFNTWSPTNALLSSSQSLLTPEDIAAGFTSNLEKLLYNIREHMAANLPDRTGLSSLTLTMSASVKSAIQADTATANAFANKNWIIA